MKKLLYRKQARVLVLLFVLLLSAQSSAQVFEWARSGGSTMVAAGSAIATDGKGNIYAMGTFYGKEQFGATTLSSDARDVYLVKYNPQGKVLWAKRAGSAGDDLGNAIAVDKEGNCEIGGSFLGSMYLDGDTLVSHGQQDMFIARYNANGKLLWARSAGGPNADHAMSMSLDEDGNTYVAGFFKDTISFGDNVVVGTKKAATFSIFLAKYNDEGKIKWAKETGGANYYSPGEGLQVATNPDGDTYVTGYYQTEANFDGEVIKNHGTFGLFIAKYNDGGKLKWVKSSSKDGSMIVGKAIALDSKGNAYVTGTFTATAVFDTITEVSKNLGNAEMFLAKYNPKGDIIWLRRTTGFGMKSPNTIAIDADGNPIVAGMFHDTAAFGTVTCSTDGSDCFFIVKYNAKGDPIWARQGGKHGKTYAKAIDIDKSGNVYMTGNYSDTADFGKARLNATDQTQDAFFAKLSPRLVVNETRLPDSATGDLQMLSCEVNGKYALVKFSIPRPAFVTLRLYDEIGDVVEAYIEGQRAAGVYDEKIDLVGIAPGDYYCRLQAGLDKATKKITVRK